jgi:hypothetical protein
MSTPNHGRNVIMAILVVILLLFALRSLFFVMPFGIFHGMGSAFREAGQAFRNGWHFSGLFGNAFLFTLPLAFLVLWIFVLVWVYRDAEQRGMSGILWMLLVLIGNIIGLIIYLIVRSESGHRPPATPSHNGKCPSCGKDVGGAYAYCPYCGTSLKPVCPSCKKPVNRDWKVCPNCGTSLEPDKVEQA